MGDYVYMITYRQQVIFQMIGASQNKIREEVSTAPWCESFMGDLHHTGSAVKSEDVNDGSPFIHIAYRMEK